jgi:alpha-galactosidase
MSSKVSTTSPEDMAQSRLWTGPLFSNPGNLPISFRYGGQPVNGIPESWNPVVSKNGIDANMDQIVINGFDAQTGLSVKVECLVYRDYAVVEWTAYLSNQGTQPSPILSDFLGLSASFEMASPGRVIHCNGDFYSADGYTPQETILAEGKPLRIAPVGGRPCDQAFPYFRLTGEGCGLTLAVGWPGQWSAQFAQTGGQVRIEAGQEKTHLRLNPGETIRSPRITLMTWVGEEKRAVNLWRRWYLNHVLPRPNGKPLQPLLAVTASDEGNEFTGATEENQICYANRFKAAGVDFDIWWLDAGWYPCANEKGERIWWLTGTWTPDPERFPRGLRPVTENLAGHGARLLLWFEPERVTRGSRLDTDHPEWLLRIAGEDGNRLFNLGNPAARSWLTEHICRTIQHEGIGVYRQDFNFDPLPFWRGNEAEDRQGAVENFYVQGYLRYWDDLLERNPGLWIDSCASGGRRNDLETMRRAVPLHYTDYGYGKPTAKLSFHQTLFQWLPYFKEWTMDWEIEEGAVYNNPKTNAPLDSYTFHCSLAAFYWPIINIKSDTIDHSSELRQIDLWRKAAPILLNGDYYPLTPFHARKDGWVGFQFDLPEQGRGFVQTIRPAACTQEIFVVSPEALSKESRYIFENPESGERIEATGEQLAQQGFSVTLPGRSGALWFYRRFDGRDI